MNAGIIDVEVIGAHLGVPELSCEAGGRRFNFVADPALKVGRSFRIGAFFSKAVLGEDVVRYPRGQRIAVLAESPIDRCYSDIAEVVRRFPLVFTHQAELLARGAPFAPLHFGTNWLGVIDQASTLQVLEEHPPKSALVSFIGSLQHPDTGAYRFRREVAEYLVSRGDVDCFGRGLRPIEGKREALATYRFSVAMENAASDDYFSEKLVDCLLMETVPVYFGWPGAARELDAQGLLSFSTIEELQSTLAQLSPELYERMRPHALANKQRVVEKRWHNHQGMLERLSQQLPQSLLAAPPRAFRESGRFGRAWRRLRKALLPGTSNGSNRSETA
jgi:hypothetical protein